MPPKFTHLLRKGNTRAGSASKNQGSPAAQRSVALVTCAAACPAWELLTTTGWSVSHFSPAMSLTIVCLFLWVCYKDKSLIIRRGSTCKRTYHGSDFHFKNLPSACLDLTDFKIQCMSTPSPNISNAGNTIDPLYTIEVDRFRIYQSKIN